MNKHEFPSESTTVSQDEKEAMLYVKGIKEFYDHLIVYLVFACVFGFTMSDHNFVLLGLAGWGVGVLVHGLAAYEKINLPGLNSTWEKQAVEKRLGRKL